VQLHRWGLLPAVAGAGTPPVRSTTFHLADAVTTIPVKPKHGVEALYAPRRRVLDAILAEAARSAGADVRFGASVSDLRRDRAGRVTGITARAGGTRLEASADLVVGADEIAGHLLELGNAMAAETAAMTSGDPSLRLELASA
jgi:flavin-dependent dehydrogenase